MVHFTLTANIESVTLMQPKIKAVIKLLGRRIFARVVQVQPVGEDTAVDR
jgi:hypothetical protein